MVSPDRYQEILRGLENDSLSELKITDFAGGIAIEPPFSDLLKVARNLKKLDLSENYYAEPLDFIELSDVLKVNTSIRELILADTHITVDSIRALLPGIIATKTLLYLNLENNPGIGDTGGTELAEALGKNTSLYSVDLCHTGITDETVIALAKHIPKHPAICRLFLDNTRVTNADYDYNETQPVRTKVYKAIQEVLEELPHLKVSGLCRSISYVQSKTEDAKLTGRWLERESERKKKAISSSPNDQTK